MLNEITDADVILFHKRTQRLKKNLEKMLLL